MDVDAFIAANGHVWARLEALCGTPVRSRAEADEFLDLYQRTATHLSLVRSSTPDPYLVPYLSWLVARARAQAYTQGRGLPWHLALRRFVTATFPAALYRTRWWWLAATAICLTYTGVVAAWLLANPDVLYALVEPEQARRVVEHEFAAYYSEHPATSFTTLVAVNNAWVGAQSIAMGVLGPLVVMALNPFLLNLGVMAALLIDAGEGAQFFGLILPHGLLELTAIFVAAGVGVRVFWAAIVPGARTRAAAIGAEGRVAAGVALGLVGVFAVAALIEGFVTPAGVPTPVRIGVGVVAEVAFLLYVFVLGRRAARGGVTGDVTGDAAVAVLPTRA